MEKTEQNRILIQNYANMSNVELAALMGVPKHIVVQRARARGLRKSREYISQVNGRNGRDSLMKLHLLQASKAAKS